MSIFKRYQNRFFAVLAVFCLLAAVALWHQSLKLRQLPLLQRPAPHTQEAGGAGELSAVSHGRGGSRPGWSPGGGYWVILDQGVGGMQEVGWDRATGVEQGG